MSGTHDTFSPSRLAQLEHCLDWESAGDSDAASYGSRIHKLIECIATDKAIEASLDDLAIADRALRWLDSLGDLRWEHETFIPGVVPETGGTIDALCRDKANHRLIIVDWKGSLPPADSMQGKAYALNLWESLADKDAYGEAVVFFYNYMNGEVCHASYFNRDTLRADIAALIRRHGGQMGERRAVHAGCAYCKHNATCKVAMTDTTAALSAIPDTSVMPLADLLDFHTKLKAVMKRAEALESAAKERLMAAAKAGELPGYTVKSKRGNKIDWSDDVAAKGVIDRLVNENFMEVNEYNIYGLRSPAKVKEELKAAMGDSYTKETEAALAPYISQNTYDILAKEK